MARYTFPLGEVQGEQAKVINAGVDVRSFREWQGDGGSTNGLTASLARLALVALEPPTGKFVYAGPLKQT